MLKILSKRMPTKEWNDYFADQNDEDNKKKVKESVIEELNSNRSMQQVDPKLNKMYFNEDDWYNKGGVIPSEG